MEAAKSFMEKYQEMNQENAWQWNIICFFLEFDATILMLVFDDWKCFVYTLAFWAIAMMYRMKGYLGLENNLGKRNIYEITKYMPINPWDIYRIFQGYLITCVVRRIIFLEVIQILFMLWEGAFSLQGLYSPILYAISMFLGGTMTGIPWKYWKKGKM